MKVNMKNNTEIMENRSNMEFSGWIMDMLKIFTRSSFLPINAPFEVEKQQV